MSRRMELHDRVDKEKIDPTPVELAELAPPPSLKEELQRYIRLELSRMAEAQGHGSFEDEDDFEEENEEPLPLSQYELTDMIEELPPEASADPPPEAAEPKKEDSEPPRSDEQG